MFGDNLKRIRKSKKISQSDLANDLNVHVGTISHWENNKQMPDNETLIKLAKCLNVDASYLLSDDLNNDLKEMINHLSDESLSIVRSVVLEAYKQDKLHNKLKS